MSRKTSFDFRARFGAIHSASKTKKFILKNSTIGNRLFFFSELANIEFTCPENSNWWLLLPDSNLFLKYKTILQLNFERPLVMDFYSNDFSEISLALLFIISIKADTRNFS